MSLLPDLRFYYQLGAKAQYLLHAPDGWDEQMINWERNKKYYGMFREFTIPLKFVKDGAEALRRTFYQDGFSSTAQLTVQALDHTSLTYYNAYFGVFDFSTFKDTDTFVEINLIDTGLVKLIKDKESVEYLFPCWSWSNPGYLGAKPPGIYKIFWGTAWGSTDYYHWFRGMKLDNFIKLLLDKMTDGGITSGLYGYKSNLITSWLNGIMITNGYQIRYNGTVINPAGNLSNFKTTFKDFFKSIDAQFCVSFGVELIGGKETFVLETRRHSFETNLIYDLGEASNMKLSVYKEYNFKSIKAGYTDKEYDNEAYSLNEFNTEGTFEARNETTGDEYDITSKYRADGGGISQIIVNSQATAWDNDSSDDDIFFIHVSDVTNTHAQHGHACNIAADKVRKDIVTDPTQTEYNAYNAEMSPKHNLIKHRAFIDSCMYGLKLTTLNFTSGLKDNVHNETKSTFDNVWTPEYNGWTIGDGISLGLQYFRPLEFSFEAVYTAAFASALKANPRGRVKFTYLGNEYYGYVMSIETKLTGKGSQAIKLLSTNTNDLTKLIR